MNTCIMYFFRDQKGHKQINEEIIRGEISVQQIETIVECLKDGGYFIPGVVGMGETKFGVWNEMKEDSCWFELERFNFCKTAQAPTMDIDADTLVKRFQLCKDRWMTFYQSGFSAGCAKTRSERNLDSTELLNGFLDKEASFRLNEIFDLDPSVVTDDLVEEVANELKNNTDEIFNYDNIDSLIHRVLQEHGIEEEY